MKLETLKSRAAALLKGRYFLLVLALGLVLLLLPERGGEETEETGAAPEAEQLWGITQAQEEARLSALLGEIRGVGETRVLLSFAAGSRRELAQTAEGALVLDRDGGEETVTAVTLPPEYLGAVVVCQGADDPRVCLAVTRAVSTYTGLGSGHITVIKME